MGMAIGARRARRGLRTLVVGAGGIGRTVARRLRERPELGLVPVGFLDKEPREATAADGALEVLGASWDLEEVVELYRVEHVIIAFSTAPHAVLFDLVHRCRALELEVAVVPRLFEEVSARIRVEHLGGIALLRVDQTDPRGWQFDAKYAADRVVSGGLLMLLAPLLAATALIVAATSSGPVFFRQTRVGLDGREFDVLKFRTMHAGDGAPHDNAEWARRQLGGSAWEGTVAPARQDRRTPVGRALRATSIDELPQLFNVLRGEMSLIGPRPEVRRCRVMSGRSRITCTATITVTGSSPA
jgi:lipopolysaccharide/colanic/teichoic acid biosynthesis glycosyltransferase